MRTFVMLALLTAPATALAHPSLVPHQHPHGASVLPDSNLLVLGAVALALLVLIAGNLMRGGRHDPR